jgi:predicted ATPase/DNA-binding SARP family transcriptional activator
VEFRILGPLEVVRDGRALDLGGAKQRSVLAVLLVDARRAVSAEKLADAVWDGAPPPAAATTLRSYLSNLRKALGVADVLVTRDRGYVLDVPKGAIDAEVFEDLAGRGRKALLDGDAAIAAKLIDEALGLWRGDALDDFAYASFAHVEAARLEDLRVGAFEDLMEARLALGEHTELTAQLESLTTRHPLRERLWRSRMLALARAGRSGEALEVYESARRHLADELGIDPSPELRRLHESIVRRAEDVESPDLTRSGSGAFIASFVFADVERSTRMLQALGEPERYAEVIEEQRRLLRDVFVARGCRFVQAIGEELFAAFDSPTAAVRAALDGQLGLSAHDWGDADDVRVRMGVHTGETTMVGGEYVGLSVHLASRICDAGHGGQILLSQVSAELLDRGALAPAELRDVGLHVLKDFDDPVRLHQIVHPDLRRDFPAPRTLSAMPHNLPPRLTSFIGRGEETNEIASLLDEVRLVTLTGVGGVGKTRLALEVGAEVLPRYPDGVWLCELAPVSDADAIAQTIAKAIGLQRPPMTATPVRDLVLSTLEHRRTLLILDNCEHVLEPVAALINDILTCAPGVSLLATSREGIGVRGEQMRPLASLAVPPREDALECPDEASAITLFVDRARAVRPDFTVGPHNVDAVIDICRRLDGIPLGIELAAGQTSAMGPLEIAARLDKAFRFLRSGDRTVVERHRTLRAAIDWSYELLTPDEQLLLERLSVFAGKFTLEAAEEVCVRELDADTAYLLSALAGKHLVDVDLTEAETRYGLLETVRQYAQDRLTERGELESFREAHADYYCGIMQPNADPLLSLETTALLNRELANVSAAFSWSMTTANVDRAVRLLTPIGIMAQQSVEVADWSSRVIELPGINEHELAPEAFGAAAYAAWTQSDFERARTLAERALALAPEPGDPRRNPAITALTAVLMFEGRLTEAEEMSDEIVTYGDRAPGFAALWRVNRALYAGYAGDRDRALELLDEVRPVVAKYWYMRDQVSYIYAEVLDEETDPDAVIAAAERAHEHATSTGNVFVANASLLRAASVHGRRGDPERALRQYVQVIEGWRLGGNHAQQWLTLQNLAEVFPRVGLDEAALVIVGAVETDPRSLRLYGEHEARLTALVAQIEARLGPERSAAAREFGSGLDLRELVGFALRQIDDYLQTSSGRD